MIEQIEEKRQLLLEEIALMIFAAYEKKCAFRIYCETKDEKINTSAFYSSLEILTSKVFLKSLVDFLHSRFDVENLLLKISNDSKNLIESYAQILRLREYDLIQHVLNDANNRKEIIDLLLTFFSEEDQYDF